MLRIVVLIKQVIDPEAPTSSFKIDSESMRVIPPKGVPPVLNPFDENALEAALQIKNMQDVEITIVSMGKNIARTIIRKALAVGADNLILVEDDTFDDLDSYTTAFVLTQVIKKIGEYDLILCGRQASDTDAGVVGIGIAEMLCIPGVTLARKISVENRHATIEHIVGDGYVVYQVPLPALITVSNEIGELRSATLPNLMAAQKKEIIEWNAATLGIDISKLKRTKLTKLFQPVHEGKCEFIDGPTPEERGITLAVKLREAGLI